MQRIIQVGNIKIKYTLIIKNVKNIVINIKIGREKISADFF